METIKTFTKYVGRRNSEVTLEQVAAVILGQMASRDKYIKDVQVFEFAKREVTFKETRNGVVIKGRKFAFDQLHGELICTEEPKVDQEVSQYTDLSQFKPSISSHPGVNPAMPQFNPVLAQSVAQKIQQKMQRDPNVPMRHEVFRPNREDFPHLQRQGFHLTMNRPYPIYNEVIKNEMEPIYYTVQDDVGQRVSLSSLYFEPMRRGLVGIGANDPSIAPPEGRLAYVDYGTAGVVGSVAAPTGGTPPMPQLRRDF